MKKISKNFFCITKHSKILIIGGGDGGSTLSHLLIKNESIKKHDISIIDPSSTYTYQSAQTMVGGGLRKSNTIQVSLKNRLPFGIDLINKEVKKINPDEKYVECGEEKIGYDFLVLASGISPRLDLIKGLKESLEDPDIPVATNYILKYADKMNNLRMNFGGGKAVFTQPLSPIKCGGAPQKILYLCADYWKRENLFADLSFYTGTPTIFPNPFYAEALKEVALSYNTKLFFQKELVEIRGKEKIAIFKDLVTNELSQVKFNLLHATPIQKTHDYLLTSKLVNPNGYVNVNIETLQHKNYENIFALGDCADLPTSKTLSAVNEQVHVLNKNLTFAVSKTGKKMNYNGYTACPVFVGKNKVMLCEFGYKGTLLPTFFKDQRVPNEFFYFLKTYVFDKFGLYFGTQHIRFFRKFFSWRLRKD